MDSIFNCCIQFPRPAGPSLPELERPHSTHRMADVVTTGQTCGVWRGVWGDRRVLPYTVRASRLITTLSPDPEPLDQALSSVIFCPTATAYSASPTDRKHCAHMTCHCMTRPSTTLHCTTIHDTEVLEVNPRPRRWVGKKQELGMFCRGDVMSRFVILEGLERDGTGARKNTRLVSGSGSGSRLSRTTPGKLLLGPGIVSLVCLQYTICLSAYQSRRELLEKGNLIGKHARCREEDSTMSPPSDDSDPDPFSLFPLQSLDVSRAGNINHNSRSDPTEIMQQRSLTLPKAQPKRPTGCPISFSEQHKRAGCAGTKFTAADQRGESIRANGCSSEPSTAARAGAGRHDLGAGWPLHSAMRHVRTKAKSYLIRHRPTSGAQTFPRLLALARVVPFLPHPLGADNTSPRGADRSDKIRSWDIHFQPCQTDNVIPGHGQPTTNLCSSRG